MDVFIELGVFEHLESPVEPEILSEISNVL